MLNKKAIVLESLAGFVFYCVNSFLSERSFLKVQGKLGVFTSVVHVGRLKNLSQFKYCASAAGRVLAVRVI